MLAVVWWRANRTFEYIEALVCCWWISSYELGGGDEGDVDWRLKGIDGFFD